MIHFNHDEFVIDSIAAVHVEFMNVEIYEFSAVTKQQQM